MPKYIDADAFERVLMGLGEDVICDDCCYEVICKLDEAPAADVEPRKPRGKWEHVRGVMTPGGDPWLVCPFCHNRDSEHLGGIEHPKRWNWCPVCGAALEK